MLTNIGSFLQRTQPVLDRLAEHIVEIDHICFRTESIEEYERVKNSFEGELLSESMVNGRLISTIKLANPIWFGNYCIDLIEVPQPNGKYKSGWEHIELVIDHRDETEKLNCDGVNIKLHYQSLENVIHIENNAMLTEFSEIIIERFADCLPVLSGTMPLKLNTPFSDADILLFCSQFPQLIERLRNEFSSYEKFEIEEKESRGQPCLVCRFLYKTLPVEIFAQNVDPLQQISHQHLLVENRLLKLFGRPLRDRVVQRKLDKQATEPAFAMELGMDPAKNSYLELLKLRKKTDREIYDKFIHCFDGSMEMN